MAKLTVAAHYLFRYFTYLVAATVGPVYGSVCESMAMASWASVGGAGLYPPPLERLRTADLKGVAQWLQPFLRFPFTRVRE